jgi:hypothetical protein
MSLRKTNNEMRAFLSRLVNLGDDGDVLNGFWTAYQGWFRPGAFDYLGIWEHGADLEIPLGIEKPSTLESRIAGRNRALHAIRDDMRAAWETPNLHERRWKLHPLRDRFNRQSAPNEECLSKPPAPNPADDAIVFLSLIAHKLKLCENPDCKVERYLIAVKKMPRFCGVCANVFRSSYKASWWEKKKNHANAKRRKEYRSKLRQKRTLKHKERLFKRAKRVEHVIQ